MSGLKRTPMARAATALCQCGCGEPVKRRYLPGHNTRKEPPYKGPPRLCECGCGQQVRLPKHSFVFGHQHRGRVWPNRSPLHVGFDAYDVVDHGYETSCWIFRKTPNEHGYCTVSLKGGRQQTAHRAFYEHHVGPIPEGLVVDHLCRVPRCVNPGHLEPVTGAENIRRGIGAKLTMERAAAIRADVAEAFARQPLNWEGQPRKRLPRGVLDEIAERYGVARLSVIAVVKGRRWQ